LSLVPAVLVLTLGLVFGALHFWQGLAENEAFAEVLRSTTAENERLLRARAEIPVQTDIPELVQNLEHRLSELGLKTESVNISPGSGGGALREAVVEIEAWGDVASLQGALTALRSYALPLPIESVVWQEDLCALRLKLYYREK
jgi:hypothetical protein